MSEKLNIHKFFLETECADGQDVYLSTSVTPQLNIREVTDIYCSIINLSL